MQIAPVNASVERPGALERARRESGENGAPVNLVPKPRANPQETQAHARARDVAVSTSQTCKLTPPRPDTYAYLTSALSNTRKSMRTRNWRARLTMSR